MGDNLLPCPFCGHAAQMHHNMAENGVEIVKCSNENCFNILECSSDAWNTRSDIHEAELTKLRNALDVAEKALDTIVYYDGYDSCNDPAIWLIEAMDALTAIKQAKGEA